MLDQEEINDDEIVGILTSHSVKHRLALGNTCKAFPSGAPIISIDVHWIPQIGRNVVISLTDIIFWVMATWVGVLDNSYGTHPPPVGNQFVAVVNPSIIIETVANLLIILILSINPE